MTDKRLHYCDMLKGMLIFLVVFGHVLKNDSFVGSVHLQLIPKCILTLIYSFHMPLFIFIAGFFSKASSTGAEYYKKTVTTVLLPFILFHLLNHFLYHRSLTKFFNPRGTMWFLLSLFCWKMLAPAFSRIRCSILLSVVLAVIAGYSKAGAFMALSRTICFFPFFLAGYLIDEKHVEAMRKRNKWVPALLLLIVFGIIIAMVVNRIPMLKVFKMLRSYKKNRMLPIRGPILRTAGLIMSFVITFAMISLAPNCQGFLSRLGRNSMAVYLLHPFVINVYLKLIRSHSLSLQINNVLLYLLLMTGISLLICAICGNNKIRSILDTLFDRLSKLCLRQ